MTTPVPTRFSDDEIKLIDSMVDAGVAENRSAVVRLAVARLGDVERRRETGRQIVDAYLAVPPTADEDGWAMASTIALLAGATE